MIMAEEIAMITKMMKITIFTKIMIVVNADGNGYGKSL